MELLVFHDCTDGHIFKGRPGEFERVPPHKSLLQCEPGKGLPIGNLNMRACACHRISIRHDSAVTKGHRQ